MDNGDYFALRNIEAKTYEGFTVPAYLTEVLNDPDANILDFGCGFGQMISALKQSGFSSIEGADINAAAIKYLRARQITVHDLASEVDFYDKHAGNYDFVIMSHVLEHFPKSEVINQLRLIRKVIKSGGALIVMVPNAQSNTGCYWAYEDFTHHLLFTGGSLYYVLKASGFSSVEFMDTDCTAGTTSAFKRAARRVLLRLYRWNLGFWNKVTCSAYHAPSPQIFSYEIKALARA
jgi:SAM-dependent methyltransferase